MSEDLFDVGSGDCVKPRVNVSLDYAGSVSAIFNIFNGAGVN